MPADDRSGAGREGLDRPAGTTDDRSGAGREGLNRPAGTTDDRSGAGREGQDRPGIHRPLAPGRLVLASHNAGKLREVAALVAPHGMQVVSVGELGLPEPAETEDTFIGNATIKALAAARAAGLPALADDSGFSVASLGGDPGVRTADWAERPGGGRDYAMAMAKVAALAGPHADRRAWFTCALVLAWPDGHVESFEGRVHGAWVHPPRGTQGFGYDPMFVPEGGRETFGEMDPAAKHRISHRARAFALLEAACLPPVGRPGGGEPPGRIQDGGTPCRETDFHSEVSLFLIWL